MFEINNGGDIIVLDGINKECSTIKDIVKVFCQHI